MSDIYIKFCNSMDAYSPKAAFIAGIVGLIFILVSLIVQSFSFIPTAVLNNISSAFVVIGTLLVIVTAFRLGIYPLMRFNN